MDEFAQGRVRLAAELWGVQRLTLLRVIRDQVRSPRGQVLERIAEACGTSVEWLRNGEGRPPTPPGPGEMLPTPWQGRWRKLVESLALSEDVSTRLVELPGLMRRVFHVLVLMGHPVGAAIRGMEAQRKAEEFEYRGWVALLSGLIETFGRAAVKEKFEAEKLWVELQFNPVAIWRYVQDGVPTRAEDDPVRKAWEEAFRYGHEGSPGLPIQSPSLEAE